MAKLYDPIQEALNTLYGDIENFSRGQVNLSPGTPGSILKRKNAGGFEYYAHQYYTPNGKKVETYLAGPVGNPEAEAKANSLRESTGLLSSVTKSIRLLGREGFKIADSKTFATVVALRNNGLFDAGAMLIGSHAYGVLLNQLGVRAAAYATEDVDIARAASLAFQTPPSASFLEMLRQSGLDFVDIPQMDVSKPSASFKEAGKSLFHVDLLVPSSTENIGTLAVPELNAHATALPYLKYALGEHQEATLLAREGCCRLRVPTPERFALHKLIVSQLRGRSAKSLKDVSQACVLLAVLAERHPGAIEDAAKAIPVSARAHVKNSYEKARDDLVAHPRAIEVLDSIFGEHGNNDDKVERKIDIRKTRKLK